MPEWALILPWSRVHRAHGAQEISALKGFWGNCLELLDVCRSPRFSVAGGRSSVSRIIRLSTAVYLLQYIIIICIQYQKEKDLARCDRNRFTSSITYVLQLYWGPQKSQMTKFQKVFLYIFGERFEFTSIFQQKQALTTKVTSVPLHPCIILYLFFYVVQNCVFACFCSSVFEGQRVEQRVQTLQLIPSLCGDATTHARSGSCLDPVIEGGASWFVGIRQR